MDHRGNLATTPLDFEGRTGTFKIRVARGQNGDLGRLGGLSMMETRYQHGFTSGFTSPSPWCKPTDATLRRCGARSGGRLRWRAGLRGEAVDRLSGGGDGMRGGRSSLYPLHSRPSDPPRGPEVVHLAFGGRTQNVRKPSASRPVGGRFVDLNRTFC